MLCGVNGVNGVTLQLIWSNIRLDGITRPDPSECLLTIWRNNIIWISMSRAAKPSKSNKRILTQPIQPGLQIKRYLVKRKRKPTGDTHHPNKKSAIVLEASDWEDITMDDSSSDSVSQQSVSQQSQPSSKMSSKDSMSTIPAINAGLSEMEERLHTKLTTSLTLSITENLKSFIDSKLDEALNRMTDSMATLVANDSSLQQQ